MIRLFFRLVVLLLLFAVVAYVFLGWRPSEDWLGKPTVGRAPDVSVDTGRAREVGAEIGSRAAAAASQAQAALADGSITAKIKAKMALDDLVSARDIRVEYAKGVVTLSGSVSSQGERARALQLATETSGVSSVVDRLTRPEKPR